VIHDGNEYLYNQCLMRGIPQIIVTDGTWRTSWDAQAAGRVGFGISLNLDLLSMATLYESYRRLLSDDWFRLRAEAMKEEYRKLGDLNAFLELIG
jgi:UDP:flavonoid glycosyltransferase YjiC (YdhE family)